MTSDTLPKTALASVINIQKAAHTLRGIIPETPLLENINLSDKYGAQIYLKREDLQPVRSYKIRGAYYKISGLSSEDLQKGVVCASAGNHAQGVAFACNRLQVRGVIFMPNPTPKQKVNQVNMFGKDRVEIKLCGDTFDDAYAEAKAYCERNQMTFIHPFDDPKVIEGQGTVGMEIFSQMSQDIDYIILPVGGGGLSAGVGSYIKQVSPQTKIIGVEPEGAPTMQRSLEKGQVTTLDHIDKFVDGAAVQRVGQLNFKICQQVLDEVITVPEGKVCSTILKLYNEEAIVVEPAGSLSIAALDFLKGRPDFR
ncbi:MAG: threonine ammonia-lyase, partial [Bacteroidota bacterium]